MIARLPTVSLDPYGDSSNDIAIYGDILSQWQCLCLTRSAAHSSATIQLQVSGLHTNFWPEYQPEIPPHEHFSLFSLPQEHIFPPSRARSSITVCLLLQRYASISVAVIEPLTDCAIRPLDLPRWLSSPPGFLHTKSQNKVMAQFL